jgi:threonine/homoserine/homoserine lactone efflux protein
VVVTIFDAVLAFAVVAGLLTLVPGIDTALVLRASLARTRGYAVATALGVATGVMLWGIAAAVGISALLTASQLAYRVLTTAGAVYMLWLGASLLWKSFRAHPVETATAPATPALDPSRWRGWLVGLGSNVLNPKAGVFYIAVIPQFLPAGASPLLMGTVLAGVHCVLFLTWCAVLILGSGYARRWLNTPRSLAIVDRVTGAVLIGFGGKLTLDSWPTGPIPPAATSPRAG